MNRWRYQLNNVELIVLTQAILLMRERDRERFLFTILSILISKNRVWTLLWKLFDPIICASHVDHFVYDYTTSRCLWERERESLQYSLFWLSKNQVWMLLWKLFNYMIRASHVDDLVDDYNGPRTISRHWWERESLCYKTLCILAFKESSMNASTEAF